MKKIIAVLDTETLRGDQVYDIGYKIIDLNTKEDLKEKRFIVRETFPSYIFGNTFEVREENFNRKKAFYVSWILKNPDDYLNLKKIRNRLIKDFEDFGVSEVWAYNGQFDYRVLNNTYNLYYNTYKVFLPYQWSDIMGVFKDAIYNTPKYQDYCKKWGLVSPKTQNPQYKAETAFRYLSGEHDFVEKHTALEDVEIESFILKYCYENSLVTEKNKKLFREEEDNNKFLYEICTQKTEKYNL